MMRVLVLSSGLAATAAFAPSVLPLNETSPLAIRGDDSPGIFDPSLTPWNATHTLLSYSSYVNSSFIFTRFAYVSDAGIASYACDVNMAAASVVVSCGGNAMCNGSLVHEVSSALLLPPMDERQRLLVLTHTYIVDGAGTPNYTLGHVRADVAECAAGSVLDMCECTWSHVPLLGWNAGGPYFNSGLQQNVNDIPELAGCVAMSEPALLMDPTASDTVLLALTCVNVSSDGATVQQNVVLLSATLDITAPAFISNFSFNSVLLYGSDMLLLTFNISAVSAGDLFSDASGNLFLAVSPFAKLIAPPTGYFGCLTFSLQPVPGLQRYAVMRVPGSGMPIPTRYVVPSVPFFSGSCSALPAGAMQPAAFQGDYLMAVLLLQPPNVTFSVFVAPFAAP